MKKTITFFETEALALGFKCIEKIQSFLPIGLSDNDLRDFMNILEEEAELYGLGDIEFEHIDIAGNWKDYYQERVQEDLSIRYVKLPKDKVIKRKEDKLRMGKSIEEIESQSPESLIKSTIERVSEHIKETLPTKNKELSVNITRTIFNRAAGKFKSHLLGVYIDSRSGNVWKKN